MCVENGQCVVFFLLRGNHIKTKECMMMGELYSHSHIPGIVVLRMRRTGTHSHTHTHKSSPHYTYGLGLSKFMRITISRM